MLLLPMPASASLCHLLPSPYFICEETAVTAHSPYALQRPHVLMCPPQRTRLLWCPLQRPHALLCPPQRVRLLRCSVRDAEWLASLLCVDPPIFLSRPGCFRVSRKVGADYDRIMFSWTSLSVHVVVAPHWYSVVITTGTHD